MKKILFCAGFVLVCTFPAIAQMITTIAGTGGIGFSGDGGPAIAAELGVRGIRTDIAGTLYFADPRNHRIRKIDAAGIITTIAGCCGVSPGYSGDGGPATAAKLTAPYDLCFDRLGNIYMAELNSIRKIDAGGIITTFAGASYSGYFGDGGQASAALLNHTLGIAADGIGNIYVSDAYNHRIRKVDTSGIITTFVGTGTAGYAGDGGPATDALIGGGGGLVTDSAGNLYFADGTNNVIRKVDTAGIVTTIAGTGVIGLGGDGIPATASALYGPLYLALDSGRNIYFSDVSNNRVRKINISGIISTIAGNGTAGYHGDDSCAATMAQMYGPTGVAIDASGSVYMADSLNTVIRKIIPDHAPSFTGGHSHSFTLCEDSSKSLNTLLAITDIDAGQTETWNILSAPSHGTAAVAYTAMSSGGGVTPVSLSYNPAAGYAGTDTFMVTVKDCVDGWDTVTFYVSIADCMLTSSQFISTENNLLHVLPNPVDEIFTIELVSATYEKASVVITDITGKTIKELCIFTNQSTDIKLNIPAGVYFLSATTANGKWYEKIIKR